VVPILAIVAGVLFLLGAIWVLLRQRRTFETVSEKGEMVATPSCWDEQAITKQMHLYRKEPALLSHFVFAIKERFILGQNDRTTQVRTRWLKSALEQLTIEKDIQGVTYELMRQAAKHTVDMLDLDIQKMDAESRRANQGVASNLKREDELLDIQLRIAQKRQQIEALTRKPPTKTGP
jgi:hypothetical protein